MKLATVRPIKKVTIIKRLISHIKYLYCEQSLRRHNFNVLLENEELNLSMIISNIMRQELNPKYKINKLLLNIILFNIQSISLNGEWDFYSSIA